MGEDSWQNDFGIDVSPDGTFTARRPTAADPGFNIRYRPHDDEARFFKDASLRLVPPPGTVERYRTRFTDLKVAPARIARGDQATVTGWIVQDDVDWSDPLAKARIEVDYVPKKGAARHVSAGTNAHGRFQARVPVAMSGCLYVRYRADTRHLASERKYCVDARTKTGFSKFRAFPRKNAAVGVAGVLLQRTNGWRALVHQKVTVYFQADGSSRWVKKGVLVTNSHGAFAKTFKRQHEGTWRAVFGTLPGYWGSESARKDVWV